MKPLCVIARGSFAFMGGLQGLEQSATYGYCTEFIEDLVIALHQVYNMKTGCVSHFVA